MVIFNVGIWFYYYGTAKFEVLQNHIPVRVATYFGLVQNAGSIAFVALFMIYFELPALSLVPD